MGMYLEREGVAVRRVDAEYLSLESQSAHCGVEVGGVKAHTILLMRLHDDEHASCAACPFEVVIPILNGDTIHDIRQTARTLHKRDTGKDAA